MFTHSNSYTWIRWLSCQAAFKVIITNNHETLMTVLNNALYQILIPETTRVFRLPKTKTFWHPTKGMFIISRTTIQPTYFWLCHTINFSGIWSNWSRQSKLELFFVTWSSATKNFNGPHQFDHHATPKKLHARCDQKQLVVLLFAAFNICPKLFWHIRNA